MKILIDMNLSPKWVHFFDENQILAEHWSKIGRANASDVVIFDYARQHHFVVFTNDLDFGAILAATKLDAPSVFQVKSQELMPELIGTEVIRCVKKYEDELLAGCLLTFDLAKIRVRILPIN